MRGAFEQARVDVEDVAGKGFASGWPAEQEGKLPIGAGMLREIVIDDQHIPTRFHEVLGNARRGVRSDVGEPWRLVALGHDHHGVIHHALLPQDSHGLRHGGSSLANGTIHAHHILAPLVEDGVERNRGFACLSVTQNQFSLAAPDRNERIDDFETGLEWHGDGRAVHDWRGGAFDGQALVGGHGTVVIERPTERVDDAPQQSGAHGHVHNPARALDLIACVQVPVVAEQHDTDFVLIHVERNAEHSAGKFQKLLKTDAGEAADPGDACGNVRDRAYFMRPQLRREGLKHLAYSGKGAVEDTLQALRRSAHWLFVSGLDSSGLGAALVSGSGPTLLSGLGSTLASSLVSALASGLGSTLASGLASALASGLGSALTSGLGSTLASGLSFSFSSSPTPFSRDAR